ncbi:MAG: hypothetical protein KA297_01750 [Kofleriaceae bacterium]|nr:hypothetical protein [Kofleriaceae bacterium]MBP6841141.1 hypothetical protein [Kofleriaceae bacterium]
MRPLLSLLVAVATIGAARVASATCSAIADDGSYTCCAPGGPCTTVRPDRPPVWLAPGRRLPRPRLELSALAVGSSYRDRSWAVGGRLTFTRLRPLRGADRNDAAGRRPRVLCAPVACGLAVGRVAPGAWLGNERGAELSVAAWADGGLRIAARPVLRNAIDSRWRLGSVVGAWLPEVVVSLGVGANGDERDTSLVWSPAALSLAVTSWLALDAEPLRVGVTLDGDLRARGLVEAGLGVRLMR